MRVRKLAFTTFLIILILTGCARQDLVQPSPTASATHTSPPTATSTPIQSDTPPPIPTQTPTIGLTLTPMRVFDGGMEKGDYLIYQTQMDHKLYFYDPATDIHIPLLPEWEIYSFAVSIDDRIAFSAANGETADVYILEYPYWENTPINITNTEDISEHLRSWSPDGSFLILSSTIQENRSLVVWDGLEFNTIYEGDEETRFNSGSDWSPEGKYALVIFLESGSNSSRGEIFMWNGNPGEAAVNVSQDPESDDRSPIWSSEGDLAYESSNFEAITIWDEISVIDGVLIGSASDVPIPEPLYLFSIPSWSNENHLLFYGNENDILYEWDGEHVNPMNIDGNYGYWSSWGPDGTWVSLTPYWDNRLYIHNSSNETILELEGMGAAWSPEGRLAFCVHGNSFIISIWNGSEVTPIIHYRSYLRAMWRNGEDISCFMG